jgi:hypothetical protein
VAYLLLKSKRFSVLSAVALGIFSLVGMALGGAQVPQTKGKDMDLSEANRKVNERPLSFVENAGQWNSNAKFLLRSSEIDYWVTSKGFVLDYKAAKPTDKLAGHAVAVEFAGGNQAKVAGEFRKDVIRDFVNKDGSATRANGFNEVRSKGIYKGIDLRSYVDGRAARYDIEVAPKTDPSVMWPFSHFHFRISLLPARSVVGSHLYAKPAILGCVVARSLKPIKNFWLEQYGQPLPLSFLVLSIGVAG